MPVVALAAVSAALASALGFGLPVRLGVPVALVMIAAKRAFDASTRRARLRALADDWLVKSASPNPGAFAWRVDELLGSERNAVAHLLGSYADEVVRPWRPGAPRLNRRVLRRDADLLATVAGALRDHRCALSPRAVVRARSLVTDPGGPLHSSARHADLREALEQILGGAAWAGGWNAPTIDGRRAHRSGPKVHVIDSRRR